MTTIAPRRKLPTDGYVARHHPLVGYFHAIPSVARLRVPLGPALRVCVESAREVELR